MTKITGISKEEIKNKSIFEGNEIKEVEKKMDKNTIITFDGHLDWKCLKIDSSQYKTIDVKKYLFNKDATGGIAK